MTFPWDMDFFERMESKVVKWVFIIFGVSVALFIFFRNELIWLGFLPLAVYLRFYLYRSHHLRNYIGAFVELNDSNIKIVRPEADYMATISFNAVTAVSNSRSFFLPSVVVHQDNGQNLELVNFKTGLAQAIESRLGAIKNTL